ncbi:hypothetical protein ACFSQ3_09700 [Sphingobacterium corticis]|uniref:Uncharacterized protein n=1 Tax=Sphingobacterium corticis TaxID=1812823 RepID=A0ABW5NJC2_9SPHI
MRTEIKRRLDLYLDSDAIINILEVGQKEMLRKLLYSAFDTEISNDNLREILALSQKTITEPVNFEKDLAQLSHRIYEVILPVHTRLGNRRA